MCDRGQHGLEAFDRPAGGNAATQKAGWKHPGVVPEYFHGMHHVGPLMTIGGGVPIVADGALAGVAAVSGASTEDDIALAELAARTCVAALGR